MSFPRKRESSCFFLGSCLRRKDTVAPLTRPTCRLAGLSHKGRGVFSSSPGGEAGGEETETRSTGNFGSPRESWILAYAGMTLRCPPIG
jgi:hypothetical protein